MRLLYVGNPNSVHVQRWIGHFSRAGHDVHLAVVNPVLVSPDRFSGVTIHDLSLKRRVPQVAHAIEITRLRKVLRAVQPDVLHAHYVARYGWLAALSGFRPLVVTVWGGDIRRQEGRVVSRLAPMLTPFTLRRASAITVDAPDVSEICRGMTGPSARIDMVTFGADLSRFRPGLPSETMRDRLRIPLGARVVLSPRSFAPIYNIETIIKAIPDVVRRFPDAIFVLQNYTSLGNADYVKSLTELVERTRVHEHVRFAGELVHEDMPLLYNVADVVVSVPISDAVPATFFEAMACGVPLVVSDLPAYEGLIKHGSTGIRVPALDAHALADSIADLLGNPDYRRRLVEAAGLVVREKGDFDREMSRVCALYRELVSSPI